MLYNIILYYITILYYLGYTNVIIGTYSCKASPFQPTRQNDQPVISPRIGHIRPPRNCSQFLINRLRNSNIWGALVWSIVAKSLVGHFVWSVEKTQPCMYELGIIHPFGIKKINTPHNYKLRIKDYSPCQRRKK
jgi:hypothetical protein